MQRPLRVGFQGERGAFHEIAAGKLVPRRRELIPLPNFRALFHALSTRKIDYAVVAIENTLVGSIHENYDLLLKYHLPILKETKVRIVHSLIAPPRVPFKSIRKVYSQSVALGQCMKFFDKNKRIEPTPFYDTAGSVKMILEKKLSDAAAIASEAAAALYGGRILKRDIGDHKQNYTRFFLLSHPSMAKSSPPGTKTSIAFVTRNISGALFRCVSVFALRDINLTKIESRPLQGRPWEYLFYLDFIGNPASPSVRNALNNMAEITEFLRILGCYSIVS